MSTYQPHTIPSDFHKKFICWSAVIAAVPVALGFQALLNLCGLGIDLSIFTFDQETLQALSIGSYGWLIITGIVALFIGGWVVGMISTSTTFVYALLHGIIVWSITALISFCFVTTTAGYMLGGAGILLSESLNVAKEASQTLAKTSGSVVSTLSSANKDELRRFLQEETNNFFKQNSMSESSQTDDNRLNSSSRESQNPPLNFTEVLNRLLESHNEKESKELLTSFLKENTNLDSQEINSLVDKWQMKYYQWKQQAQKKLDEKLQQAKKAAESTARTLGLIALITFLAYTLSAIACIFGSHLGMQQRLKSTERLPVM